MMQKSDDDDRLFLQVARWPFGLFWIAFISRNLVSRRGRVWAFFIAASILLIFGFSFSAGLTVIPCVVIYQIVLFIQMVVHDNREWSIIGLNFAPIPTTKIVCRPIPFPMSEYFYKKLRTHTEVFLAKEPVYFLYPANGWAREMPAGHTAFPLLTTASVIVSCCNLDDDSKSKDGVRMQLFHELGHTTSAQKNLIITPMRINSLGITATLLMLICYERLFCSLIVIAVTVILSISSRYITKKLVLDELVADLFAEVNFVVLVASQNSGDPELALKRLDDASRSFSRLIERQRIKAEQRLAAYRTARAQFVRWSFILGRTLRAERPSMRLLAFILDILTLKASWPAAAMEMTAMIAVGLILHSLNVVASLSPRALISEWVAATALTLSAPIIMFILGVEEDFIGTQILHLDQAFDLYRQVHNQLPHYNQALFGSEEGSIFSRKTFSRNKISLISIIMWLPTIWYRMRRLVDIWRMSRNLKY